MTADNRPTPDDFGDFAPSGYCLRDTFRVFGGFWVSDPHPDRGLTRDHAITHDVVVDDDGEVTVEINGVPVDQLPERSGSWVR